MLINNKKQTRDLYLKIRKSITQAEKKSFDDIIFIKFINSSFFKSFDTFLIYVSVNNEVNTFEIINYLLYKGKTVAVPHCFGKNMEFYYLDSTDDLLDGKFGIPSVDVSKSHKVENFDKSLCIVPAVSFDNNGNRLGYGGGYYDRFLMNHKITTLGLCYERCISEQIPNDNFDKKINYVLTELQLRNHK